MRVRLTQALSPDESAIVDAESLITYDTIISDVVHGKFQNPGDIHSFIIFPLYLQWSSQQETDDFFDGYDG